MTRIVLFIVLAFALIVGYQGYAQQQGEQKETKKTFNELYQPLPVILRLSYENFRNIKLLNAAVVNFGGGEAEFDGLVDEYAEASSLYFRNEHVLSANKFTENEKNINRTAEKIARKYKEMTEDLAQKTIRMKVRASFRLSLSGRKIDTHPAADEAIKDAGYSLNKANDLFARTRAVESIYFYRRAKEKNFFVYKVLADQFEERKKEAQYRGRKSDVEFYEKESKKYGLSDEYKKDVVDNMNRVYESGERQKDK
jgi:hypothetical protein